MKNLFGWLMSMLALIGLMSAFTVSAATAMPNSTAPPILASFVGTFFMIANHTSGAGGNPDTKSGPPQTSLTSNYAPTALPVPEVTWGWP